MGELNLESIKQAMLKAGFEIYRQDEGALRLAERIRMHLMDSGVSVVLDPQPSLRFTVRSQRSDFPNANAEELYEKVRGAMLVETRAHGFEEAALGTQKKTDPVDSTHLLDVWYELTYQKPLKSLDLLIEDARWALAVGKCVSD